MSPDPTSDPFDPDLFVTRSLVDEQARLYHWMEQRAANQIPKKVLLLLGPPGYGKTWSLHRAARSAQLRSNPIFVVGPLDLSEAVDFTWYETKFLNPVEARLGAAIGFNPNASLSNNVAHLAQQCADRSKAHPVLVVDELDQAPDRPKVEREVLAPWIRRDGSLIVGMRYNRSFFTAELRNTTYYELLDLAEFEPLDAAEQFRRLADYEIAHRRPTVSADAMIDLINCVAPEFRYNLGVPAINQGLWAKHLPTLLKGPLPLPNAEYVHACVADWLQRKPAKGINPAQQLAWILEMGTWDESPWTQGTLEDALRLNRIDAGGFVRSLIDLNFIEQPNANDSSLYIIKSSWRSLLRMDNHLRGKL